MPKATRQNNLLFILSALYPGECYFMTYNDDIYCDIGKFYVRESYFGISDMTKCLTVDKFLSCHWIFRYIHYLYVALMD